VTIEQRAAATRSALDLDPDLGEEIPREDWEQARRACEAPVTNIASGHWDVRRACAEATSSFGYLLVDAIVSREVALKDRYLLELFGPGDIIQPPAHGAWPHAAETMPSTTTVITQGRAMALGGWLVRAAARWPSLLTAVLTRIEAQRERLAIQGLIVHLPLAEHRVLLQLWHLAGKWGRVTTDGIVIPLQLTHEFVGQMIAARRPTVTLAVRDLEAAGCLRRLDDGSWLLTHLGERRIAQMLWSRERAGSLGEALMLRQRSAQIRSDSLAIRAEARQVRARTAHAHPAGRPRD
jgi:CRP-like cAMP-binding protein